jgi:hypothetical protein
MTEIHTLLADHLAILIPILIVLLLVLVGYYVLMTRTVIEMLRYEAHGVLLTFGFLALIPFPPVLIMGILILIIWHFHKKDVEAGRVKETRAMKSNYTYEKT